MKLNLLGRVFCSTSGQPYAYVTQTNQIIRIDREWYESLAEEDREQLVLEDLVKNGLFTEELPEKLELPLSREAYHEQIARHIRQLTLEITQQCSLRCKYCIYSGNYEHARTHQNLHMSRENAKKSIDYFVEHNVGCDDAVLSLYGGEALLNYDVVHYAVDYAKQQLKNKPLQVRISTNGTTLTPEIIDWIEKDPCIWLTVTINGYVHDTYRVFPDGRGSLDTIMDRMIHIRREHPEVWDRIQFIANVASAEELLKVRSFYMEKIGKPPVVISGISSFGGNEVIQNIIRQQNQDTSAMVQAKKLYTYDNDPYLKGYYQLSVDDLCIRSMTKRVGIFAHASCCMPFDSSLFVAADGTLCMCEKAAPSRKYGTIEKGIDMDYLDQLMEQMRRFLNGRCKTCWAERLCDICYQSMDISEGQISLEEETCHKMCESVEQMLQMFVDIGENDPKRLNEMRANVRRLLNDC